MASIGPLKIERHVKSDGRTLILYTREDPPKDAGAAHREMRVSESSKT